MEKISPLKKVSIAILTILTILYFCNQFIKFTNSTLPQIKRFISADMSYKKMRNASFISYFGNLAKKYIPLKSKVQTSFPLDKSTYQTVELKYILYPIEVKDKGECIFEQKNKICRKNGFSRDNWDYFIDFHKSINNSKETYKELSLGNGVRLFAKKQLNFLPHKGNNTKYPFLRILFIFCLTTIFIFSYGHLILGCFQRIQIDKFWLYGACYLIGFVFLNFYTWIFLIIGGKLTKINLLAIWSFAFAITFLVSSLIKNKCSKNNIIEASEKETQIVSKNIKSQMADKLINGIYFSLLLISFCAIISIPINVWDEMWIWLLKAKVFFYQSGLDFKYTSSANNYYPLLWPINIATHFSFLGGSYDEVAKWTSAIIFLCFISQMQGALKLLGANPLMSKLMLCVYILTFNHWVFYTALPENMLLALLSAVTALLLGWLNSEQKNKQFLILAMFMLAGLSGTKFEGGVITILCFLGLFLSGICKNMNKKNFFVVLFFVPAILIPIAWIFWLNTKNVPIYIFHIQNTLCASNVLIILNILLGMLRSHSAIIPVSLFLCFVILNAKSQFFNRQNKFLFLTALLITLFSFSAGLRWPSGQIARYYPEVLSRLFLRATPFIMLFLASLTIKRKNV